MEGTTMSAEINVNEEDEEKPSVERMFEGIDEQIDEQITFQEAIKEDPVHERYESFDDRYEDNYLFTVKVSSPEKRGDGMYAYVAYNIITKTTLSQFKKAEMSVFRRYSDFLGLHEKLLVRHNTQGLILPVPPEKNMVGSAKIRLVKEDISNSKDFIEKRRAALERYLSRIGRHPILRNDQEFREFIELDTDLPKSASTATLSGASVMKLFKNVGEQLDQMYNKVNEFDPWFDERKSELASLKFLRDFHFDIEYTAQQKQALAEDTLSFAKSIGLLAESDNNSSLHIMMTRFSKTMESISELHQMSASADTFILSELINDHANYNLSVEGVLQERIKIIRMCRNAELILVKKNNLKDSLETQNKIEKVKTIKAEIVNLEQTISKYQKDMEDISKTIKAEFAFYEKNKSKEYKTQILEYLEKQLEIQQGITQNLDGFISRTKADATSF